MSQFDQLRKGSTKLLVLNALADKAKYGYQIMRELEGQSDGYFSITAASLYPTLHGLEEDGLVVSEWREEPGKRRRKYYTLTEAGGRALTENMAEWQTFAARLFAMLKPNAGTG